MASRSDWAALLAAYADNATGDITADALRSFVLSVRPHVASTAPTTGSDVTLGFDVGHAWLDTSGPTIYECIDPTVTAAAWVQVYPQAGSGGAAWGGITGTLSDQLDLQNALDAKANTSSLGTAAALNAPATGDAAVGEVVLGADSRLSDARPPTGHAASHKTGGSDALTPADIGAATAAQGALASTALQPGDELTALAATGVTAGHVPKADGSGGISWAAESGGGGGAAAFTDLTDAPSSYAGQGGKLVAVNSGATGLEFVTAGGGGGGIPPADGLVIVHHGATAGTARPTAGVAYWMGSVEPTNKQTGDFWLETGAFD